MLANVSRGGRSFNLRTNSKTKQEMKEERERTLMKDKFASEVGGALGSECANTNKCLFQQNLK